MKRIVVAVDGSAEGRKALEMATQIAASFGATLEVVHVLMHRRPSEEFQRMAEVEHLLPRIPQDRLPETAMQPGSVFLGPFATPEAARRQTTDLALVEALGDSVLEDARERAQAAGVGAVETTTLEGDEADAVVDHAERQGADMIVVGSRGLGRVGSMVLGSVSRKIAGKARMSVLVAR